MRLDQVKRSFDAWLQGLPAEEQALLGEEDFDYLFRGLAGIMDLLAEVYTGPALSAMQSQAPLIFQMWAVSLYQHLESAGPWLSEVRERLEGEAYQRMNLTQRHQEAIQALEAVKAACLGLQSEIARLEDVERQREESHQREAQLAARKEALLAAVRANPTPEGLEALAEEVRTLEQQYGEAADLLAHRQEIADSLRKAQAQTQAVQEACDQEDLPRLAQGLQDLSQAIEAKAQELAPRLDQVAPCLIQARRQAQHLVEELAKLEEEEKELRNQIERRSLGLERYQRVNRELAGHLGAGQEVHRLLDEAEQNLRECDRHFRQMLAQRDQAASGPV